MYSRQRHRAIERSRAALHRPRLDDPDPSIRTLNGIRVIDTKLVMHRGQPKVLSHYEITFATLADDLITVTRDASIYRRAVKLEGTDRKCDVVWHPFQDGDHTWVKLLDSLTGAA